MLSLEEKLKRIDKVFGIKNIVEKSVEMEDLKRYYRVNRIPYKVFHSREGFLHHGISRDGKLKKEDFYAHADYVDKYIIEHGAKNVLELAAGNCSNVGYLARKHSTVNFSGLDLNGGLYDVNDKRINSLKNVKLFEGDYHNLELFSDNQFDIVYVFEALCYSDRKGEVAKEVKRVLKDKGIIIVLDGYLSRNMENLSENELICQQICAKGLMLRKYYKYEDVSEEICEVGFKVVYEEDLSNYLLPNTRKNENLASKTLFNRPLLGKFIASMFPSDFSYNAAFGYLSPDFLELNIAKYMVTVFQKRS